MIVSPDIKAIPTTYGGIKFRSRTEARWAVFFDALGVRWEYEHEGYQLPSGWYLPDFWLPEVNGGLFVEIKPERAATREEMTKLFGIVSATRREAVMFHGQPGDGSSWNWGEEFNSKDGSGARVAWSSYDVYNEDDTVIIADGEPELDFPYRFNTCPRCNKVGLVWEFKSERICNLEWRGGFVPGDATPTECRERRMEHSSIDDAVHASRTRRFW